VSADPSNRLAFDKRLLRTTAGRVTLILDNPSQLAHNIVLAGRGVYVQGITVGQYQTSTVRAILRAGRYMYFCSVPGHRKAGMDGTLIVG
jgi:plastocyanin